MAFKFVELLLVCVHTLFRTDAFLCWTAAVLNACAVINGLALITLNNYTEQKIALSGKLDNSKSHKK